MKAITYKTRISGGIGIIDRTGYPTSAPGLLVSEAYAPCRKDETHEWVVVHARTGLVLPFCWDSPEAVLAYTEKVAILGDWQQDHKAVRRLTLNAGRLLSDYAHDVGGRWHLEGEPGDGSVDNGVVA